MSLRIANPYAGPGRWLKAQLHCHSTESDGRIPPRELLQMYKDTGYAFVCITDHNHVTRCDDFNDDEFLALPGTEDTVTRWIPPLGPHMGRLLVDGPLHHGSAQERIDRTRAAGGIVSLCHPSWTGNLWTGAWAAEEIRRLRGFHLFEVCNLHSSSAEDTRRWMTALQAHGPHAPVWAVAVDDCHHRDQFNRGWIVLKSRTISVESFREALLGGAFYASTGLVARFTVADQTIGVEVDRSGLIQFTDAAGRIRHETAGSSATYVVSGSEGFVRIEALAADARVWSQPFWITPESNA